MRREMHLIKRVLSLIMVFAMVLAMVPAVASAAEEGATVYLKPNSNWLVDNARFAIYYWNDGGSFWTDMSDADGDGYYEGTVPAGYTNIIFCRMNPSTTENNWDNKWNQSSDLTVPTDGTNCYTVADGTWDSGGGTWSKYTVLYLKPNANWLVDGARFAAYFFGNGETWLNMTDNDGDGYYQVAVPEGYPSVIFCRMNPNNSENGWSNKWNQTSDLTVPTDGTNCYTVADGTWDSGGGAWSVYTPEVDDGGDEGEQEPENPAATYYVAGDSALCGSNWNEKDSANQMTYTADGKYKKTYTNVTAGTYSIKVTDGTWDNTWGDNGSNYTFVVSEACDVTVTFDPSAGTVAVTGENVTKQTTLEITTMHAVGNGSGNWLNGKNWDTSANAMTEVSDNVYEITFEDVVKGNAYEVKFAADGAWTHSWGSGETEGDAVYNGQNIKVEVAYELADVTLKLDMTEYDHNTKSGAKYTITVTEVTSTDPSEPSEPDVPEGDTEVTIHFAKPADWGSTVNAYIWATGGAVAGYDDYNSWPGKAITDTDNDGWYDLVVVTEETFNFIFNDGSNQTSDLTAGEVTGDKELWVVGNDVHTEKPKYTIVIHYQKPESWSSVNAYVWDPFAAEGSSNVIPGYEAYNPWPGAVIEENESNPGWYDMTISKDTDTGFNFIFHNNSGSQTGDLWSDTLSLKSELWFYTDETSSTSAPSGWFDPNRTVHIPGTFPGPSWDAASNQMTYDPELGLYVYTFEDVAAAKYEFKIAINGSWDENYGANGELGGANISVQVPEKQDVTIWYNDETHRTQCSVYYELNADVSLSGNGIPEGTKLTDPGLTGLYSVTLPLDQGEYTDLKVTYGDLTVALGDFALTEAKDVTFWFDPSTQLAYHNGSNVKVVTSNIFYDSKDLEYKDPYGAVAAGEEVTFRLQTGVDATNVSLIVKGQNAVAMEKDGEAVDGKQLWKCTTKFGSTGEYQYYFAITNGSDMVFYTDDVYNDYLKKGDYGTGAVRDINNLLPYDLVVYVAGYETPDWMKNAVVYQIFPDRFFDGDESNNQAQTTARGEVDYEYVTDWYMLPENPSLTSDPNYPVYAYKGDGEWSNEIYGGDLKGITEKIDYLKALGVNVIYLNPVFSSISNHRYDACDYMEIDPILGTLGDFEELVAVAEANGMKIILDGVFNHVSDDSVYFDRYYKFLGKSEKIGAYPYWAYVYDYMAENQADQTAAETAAKAYFSEEYGITDYSYTEWFAVENATGTAVDNIGLRAGKPVYGYEGWWGYDSMPVIKSTNGSEYQTGNWAEEVIYNEDGSSVTQYWISKGNNGWRLDVANEVSDETWNNFRNSVKALDSDAVIIGEIWSDATYYLMGDMYDSVMNYVFRDAVAGFARGYQINRDNKAEKWDADFTAADALAVLDIIRERYPEEAFYAMMNLVASHDTARILSYLDDVEDDRYQTDIANNFPMYETTSDRAKQLQYVVSFIQFTYAGAPTIYYGDEIGMTGADDPDDRRAFTWGKGNQEIVEWYAELAAIRAQYPALRTGSVDAFAPDRDVMGYVRSDANDTLIVMANRAASAKTVTLDLAEMGLVNANARADMTLTDLISGTEYTVSDGKVTVNVPAYRGVILTQNVKSVSVNTAALAPAYTGETVAERCAHAYTSKVVAPTCTKEGYTEHSCSKCGNTYQDTKTNALGHDYKAVVTKPTCTEKGYTTHTCSVCGDSYKDAETAALGHKYESAVTKPTCTEKGYTTHTCSVCGDSYKDAETAALGHDYKSVVTKPTATKKGYTTHTCKVCDHSYVDSYTDALGPNAPTGDSSNIALWSVLLIVSLTAMGVIVYMVRRKMDAE